MKKLVGYGYLLLLLVVIGFLYYCYNPRSEKFSSVGDMLYDMGDNSFDEGDPYSVDANKMRLRASVSYMDRDQNMGYF